ncbi:hypothetical protein HDV00_005562 [Rhizophlyctis rosea]|nr:hypothetical protein HDV00_005562 [Rhizophlyctis rosea]
MGVTKERKVQPYNPKPIPRNHPVFKSDFDRTSPSPFWFGTGKSFNFKVNPGKPASPTYVPYPPSDLITGWRAAEILSTLPSPMQHARSASIIAGAAKQFVGALGQLVGIVIGNGEFAARGKRYLEEGGNEVEAAQRYKRMRE